jgi:hypothetical protein
MKDSETPRPVFVTGSYRSGTSILTWALGAHPHFHPLEETGWLAQYGTGALAGYDLVLDTPRNFFDVYGVSRSEFGAQVGAAIDAFMMRVSANGMPSTERRRWVDGTPENTKHVLLLRQLFPEAKFVFLVRNPKDTVASLVHFDRAGGAARSISAAARAWSSLTHRGLLAYRAFGPDVVKIVLYADLLDEPAATLKGIFEFLGDDSAPEAEAMMQQRINSSNVTSEEREAVHRRIDRSGWGKRLRRQYDEVLSVMAAPWSRDEEALLELESLQPLPTRVLASGQFAPLRWVLARIRERIK